MKKSILFLALVAVIGLGACKDNKASSKITLNEDHSESELASKEETSGEYPEITFDEANYDFGAIKEGEVVEHVFNFKNTGTQPLKVSQAQPSCGCTAPHWTREEIAPGESGSVTVQFDSKGRPGQQNKSVRLITNTKNGNETVRFTAQVD